MPIVIVKRLKSLPLLRMACVAGLALSVAGCTTGARVHQLETDLQALRDEVDELKRSQAASRVQADDLRNRLVMVEEKADSARVDRARKDSGWIPKLPTVKVEPGAGETSTRPDQVAGGGKVRVQPAETTGRSRPGDIRIGAADADEDQELPDSPIAVAGPPPPAPSGPGGDLPPQLDNQKPKGDGAVALYNQAKALLDSEQVLAARGLFQKLLDAHPDHDLADNALYWIGESWYAQAQWLKAAQTFVRVAKEYPRGNKVPDAMYKLAKSYEKMGDTTGAADVLGQLAKHYPGTPPAKRAQEELGKRRTEP